MCPTLWLIYYTKLSDRELVNAFKTSSSHDPFSNNFSTINTKYSRQKIIQIPSVIACRIMLWTNKIHKISYHDDAQIFVCEFIWQTLCKSRRKKNIFSISWMCRCHEKDKHHFAWETFELIKLKMDEFVKQTGCWGWHSKVFILCINSHVTTTIVKVN